ncbi:MAG: hypothetical protein ACI8SE_001302 [Bacteroidia bacterium]|jgi:hypothetical protein
MNTKSIFIVGAIAVLGLLSCEKDPTPTVNGIITGQDFRKCACCGGWFVEVGDSTFRFYEIPKTNVLNLDNETLPLEVSIDYTQEDGRCMPDLIVLNKIRKR